MMLELFALQDDNSATHLEQMVHDRENLSNVLKGWISKWPQILEHDKHCGSLVSLNGTVLEQVQHSGTMPIGTLLPQQGPQNCHFTSVPRNPLDENTLSTSRPSCVYGIARPKLHGR